VTAPTRGRGRGRPTLFTPAARTRYLTARHLGDTQHKAAAAAGVTPRTIHNTRRRDHEFRALDDAAVTAGRLARMPHGESRYNNAACRCPVCTKDATAKRMTRKTTARRADKTAPVVAITTPDQGSSETFPLARAS
jgi:hypothetical protein